MDFISLYIHIPYCRNKCIYCDFFSRATAKAPWSALTDSLLEEYRRHEANPEALKTIYLGGGTPSLMPLPEMERLCKGVIEGAAPREFTIEVNPDDVTEERALAWKSFGINRVSMGVQSFLDSDLRFLRRRHDSRETLDAYEILRHHFSNISIDLIFALPGQTLQQWRDNVKKAIDLSPEHISAYNLMFEPGTPLTLMRDKGKCREADDDTALRMYEELRQLTSAAGYSHYEISNFAKPGHESRHNGHYWDGSPYLGLGPGAHSYDGGKTRWSNLPDINRYISHYRDNQENSPAVAETLGNTELLEELLLTRLRREKGLSIKETSALATPAQLAAILAAAERIRRRGLLLQDSETIRIPPEKWMMADAIIAELAVF